MFSFTPLHKGTIWRMFEFVPSPARRGYDPLGFPTVKEQCVHIEVHNEELSEGTETTFKRCMNNATKLGSNGWLCDRHNWSVLQARVQSNPAPRDYDQEVVEGIIKSETRALNGVERETIKIGRTTIQLVKGYVGQPVDPSKYEEF